MAPEGEGVLYANDVLTIFMIIISQRLQYFDFNLALLVQLLPVLEDLERHNLFVFVVIAAYDDTECAPSQLLLDLVSAVDLVLAVVEVVGLVVVESVIVDAV